MRKTRLLFAAALVVCLGAGCVPEPHCGNGACEAGLGETVAACPADCPSAPVCGNGTCESGETASSCQADCPIKKIKISAFNVQVFGPDKASKPKVMAVLDGVARHFDVMLVQEIRGVPGQTAQAYLQGINSLPGAGYAYVESPQLGASREAYAFFYNTGTVDYVPGSAHVYDDTQGWFVRDPYVASFRSGDFDFTLVGIHTRPEAATAEISRLPEVVDSITQENPNEKDIIVMGDFNADGGYFDEDDGKISLRGPNYTWVIGNDQDTMVKTDNTYDRMVITPGTASHEYVEASGRVYGFDAECAANGVQPKDVSDHYPIYAEFATNLGDDD